MAVNRTTHQKFDLGFIWYAKVAETKQLIWQVGSRSGRKYRPHAGSTSQSEGLKGRFDWRFELAENHVGPLNSRGRYPDVLGRQAGVGAGHNDDAVFSLIVHDNRCGAGRVMTILPHERSIYAF